MNELLDAALYYAGKGWPVIPLHGFSLKGGCTCYRKGCPSPAKHPRTEHGLSDATTYENQIREWWGKWPDANVGLRTGVAFDVLDVDGPEGLEIIANLTDADGKPINLERTIVIETGGGGRHYLFKPLDAGNRARMLPGLDWRGQGGYIVAPPSIHASGKSYRRLPATPPYGPAVEPTEAPAWLRDLVRKPVRPAQPAAVASEWTQPSVSPSYGQRALEGELHALWMAEEGGRNHQLNKSAFSLFQLVKAGALDYGDVSEKLSRMAEDIGLEAVEINRTLQSAWKSAEAREISKGTDPSFRPSGVEPALPAAGRELVVETYADIEAYKTEWLWDGRVPMGSLTLVGGREGIGKSTLCYDMVSDITRGSIRGAHNGTPRNVVVVATEDDLNRTIKPRLTAARADMSRVLRVRAKTPIGLLEPSLPEDVEALKRLVRENDVDMILLDPLLSRLNVDLDTHKDSDVRVALEPVTKLANETGCAVLGIIHVNKSGSKDPLTSLMGSRAFAAVARAVLFVMIDPEEERLRLLLQAKNNLGISDVPALRFSIDNTPAGADARTGELIYSGKLNWRGESALTVNAAMELADTSTDERTARSEAADWLIEYLEAHKGVDERKAILTAAKGAGISESTLDRAKSKANVRSKRIGGFQGPAVWYLPGHEPLAVPSDSPCLGAEGSEGSSQSPSPSVPLPSPTTTSLTLNSPVGVTGVDDEALI